MLTVDGKCLGVLEDSSTTQKGIERLEGLAGIKIERATDDALLLHKAKTKIPGRITSKMEETHRDNARLEALNEQG